MRKICRSANTLPTSSLMALALAKSLPIGFSRTSRAAERNETFGSEPPRRAAEQLGRGRHVEDADAIPGFAEEPAQFPPAGIASRVEHHMAKASQKSRQNVGSRAADGYMAFEACGNARPIGFVLAGLRERPMTRASSGSWPSRSR